MTEASSRFEKLFFFSSRRRHTRFDCDWSSDVCSSDLVTDANGEQGDKDGPEDRAQHRAEPTDDDHGQVVDGDRDLELLVVGDAEKVRVQDPGDPGIEGRDGRSEERRVGKECRSRWSPYH